MIESVRYNDGLNRRVAKEVYDSVSLDEVRHFYYSAQWQVLEERSEVMTGSAGGGVPEDADTQYVWGLRYIDDLILRDRDADGSSGNGLEERLYALQDANWNVVALAEPDGDIVERFIYDGYGHATPLAPDFTAHTGADYAWPYLFTGRRLDEETGMMQYRNRYYHIQLGRFVTRDPIGYGGGDANLYGYVFGNPLAFSDPYGDEVAIIARQFGWSEKDPRGLERGQKNAKSFSKFPGIGHFYIKITMPSGKVYTFSYHPNTWPKGDNLAPFYKIRTQVDNLVDGNNKRPARVWENDPADMSLKIGKTPLLYKKWVLQTCSGDEQKLFNHIYAWIMKTGAGHEIGKHTKDPANPNNTVGENQSRPNTGDQAYYWVYGQNCGWWATTMAKDCGLKCPQSVIIEMTKYNQGVGIKERYYYNQQFIDRARQEKTEAGQKIKDIWDGLWGKSRPYGAELDAKSLYPLKMEPDERTDTP